MRPILRQLVTSTLLACYGSISLLGHGLHWLSLDDHHHHGLVVAHCEHHHSPHPHHHCGHGHHEHNHEPLAVAAQDRAQPLEITASEKVIHAHDCEICTFLSQARGERPRFLAPVVGQHVAAAASAALQRLYSPVSLGLHAPRGPPALLA